MFEQLGYDCSEIRNKGRRLILPVKNANIEIVLAKAADVITYVENGVCDLGVVGKDTIMEAGGTFYEVADLGFGRCRFALALPAGVNFTKATTLAVLPANMSMWLAATLKKKNMDVDIVKIEGSVELAPILGLSDAIVDIVETGTTLRENGLVVAEEICQVSARLIVNIASMKLRKAEIDELITKIEAYVQECNAQKKAQAEQKGAEQA